MVGLNKMNWSTYWNSITDVKQMSWDVKLADMKYLATMAKNEAVPLTQKRKEEMINKAFCGIKCSLFS